MTSYLVPIKVAVLTFPFLALLIAAPILVYYYRKYGRLGKLRSLILYSFIFYLLCAYYLVILPLPTIQADQQLTGPTMQLRLFQSSIDFFNQTVLRLNQPSTYLPALKQMVFLEPIFNIALFVPLGVYGRYYFGFSWKKTLFISFGLSLFFELTQLSGLYFIYPRPYRLFDVDDLLHNTSGGVIGYLIAPLFTFFLPTRQELDLESLEEGQKVTFMRRFVAYFIDWFVINLVVTLLQIAETLAPNSLLKYLPLDNAPILFTLEVVLYFMLLPYLTNGQTFGKRIVRIRVMAENKKRISLGALMVRYGLFYLMIYYLYQIFGFSLSHLDSLQPTVVIIYGGLGLISFGILLLFGGNLLYAFLRKKQRLFHEKASHTYTISTVEKEV